jgi:copper homeostasis protein
MAAETAGAQRIELCAALDSGGVSPSAGLIKAAINALKIPVNVLIRPREGDFCYSQQELEIMLSDIHLCKELGANGVVVGALKANAELDLPKLEAMKKAAGSMELVQHRAFDFCANPEIALEQLIDLGFCRILSSGQSNSAFEGRFLLQKMVQKASGRISLMPGAGITEHNIHEIAKTTGAQEFHFTAKLKYKPHSEHEIQGLDSSYWQSDVDLIRRTMNAAL